MSDILDLGETFTDRLTTFGNLNGEIRDATKYIFFNNFKMRFEYLIQGLSEMLCLDTSMSAI